VKDPLLDQPVPRWRNVKRVAIVFGVGVLVAVALRGWAGHRTKARLASLEAHYRAQGLPWIVEDMNPSAQDGRPNGATLYAKAAGMLVNGLECYSRSNFESSLPLYHTNIFQWLAYGSAIRYGPVFDLVRQARDMEYVDYGTRFNSNRLAVAAPLNYFSDARDLANELGDNALWLAAVGDVPGACERLNDNFALAKAVGQPSTILNHLVSIGITALGQGRLNEIILFHNFADIDGTAAIDRTLEALALQDQAIADSERRALAGDDCMVRQLMSFMGGSAWLTRPVIDRAIVKKAELTSAAMQDMKQAATLDENTTAYFPAPIVYFRVGTSVVSVLPSNAHDWHVRFHSTSISRMLEARRRITNERRLLATIFAARKFHAKNKRWPKSVDELVPEYLVSPYRSAHSPDTFRVEFTVLPKARQDGADRPVVYVDAYTSKNEPTGSIMIAWVNSSGVNQPRSAFSDRGRQWRDAEMWPLRAFSIEELTPVGGIGSRGSNEPAYDPSGWKNPGNPASLQAPPQHPDQSGEPGNQAEPE